MAPPKEDETPCKKCKMVFTTWNAYHLHKMNSDKHICCPVCSADFSNEGGYKRHQKFAHAQEQDLPCPGCGLVFTRVGGLMGHLEQNQCLAMYAYEARRAIVQQNTGQFERIRQHGIWGSVNDDITLPPIEENASATGYPADAVVAKAYPNQSPPVPLNNQQLEAQEESNAEVDLINFDAPTVALNSPWGPSFDAPVFPAAKFNIAKDFPQLSGLQSTNSNSRILNIMDEPFASKKAAVQVAGNNVPGGWGQPPHLASVKKENVPPRRLAPLRTTSGGTSSISGRDIGPAKTTSLAQLATAPWDRQTVAPPTPASATGFPAWSTQKNLFPDAPAAIAPPTDLLANMSISTDVSPEVGTQFSQYDPNDPNFRVGKFWVPITQKYKCPHMGCPKSLPTPAGFKQHLNSPAHMTENQKLQCVKCLRYYRDATALTQHSEAQGVRCLIREDERFGVYIDEITASTAATAGRHKDDTIKYVVNDHNPFSAASKVMEANTAAQAANEKAKTTFWQERKPKW